MLHKQKRRLFVTQYAHNLSGTNLASRVRAERYFQRAGVKSFDLLLAIHGKEANKRRARQWLFVMGTLVVAAGAYLLGHTGNEQANAWGPYWAIIVLVWSLGGLFLLPASRTQRDVAKAFALINNIRAVGPLCETLGYQDDRIKLIATARLTKLLPYLTARDGGWLNDEQRRFLHMILIFFARQWNKGKGIQDRILVIAILDAFIKIGNKSDIPPIKKVAESCEDEQVKNVASVCLMKINERLAYPTDAEFLVRSACLPAPNFSSLVRPASEASITESQQLLRPHSSKTMNNE